jgi:hypothetical protein
MQATAATERQRDAQSLAPETLTGAPRSAFSTCGMASERVDAINRLLCVGGW